MDARERMVRQYGATVWQTVHRLVGGPRHEADAADCFQEVFIAALQVERETGVRNWEALLKRLAVLKGIDALRRRMRERGRVEQDTTPDAVHASVAGPPELIGQREQLEQLQGCLAELPEQQATALALRHLSEMSYEEIAAEMGLTVNGVGVLLNRARRNLAERMNASTCERHGES